MAGGLAVPSPKRTGENGSKPVVPLVDGVERARMITAPDTRCEEVSRSSIRGLRRLGELAGLKRFDVARRPLDGNACRDVQVPITQPKSTSMGIEIGRSRTTGPLSLARNRTGGGGWGTCHRGGAIVTGRPASRRGRASGALDGCRVQAVLNDIENGASEDGGDGIRSGVAGLLDGSNRADSPGWSSTVRRVRHSARSLAPP